MRKKGEKVSVDAMALDDFERQLDLMVNKGDLTRDLEVEFSDPTMRKLHSHVCAMAESVKQARSATISLTMGLSECLQVIESVREGNMEARISDMLIASGDDLVVELGKKINEMITEVDEVRRRQQAIIQELSTPLLQIWDDILVLPVIGVVDTTRSADLMGRLLEEIVEKQAKFVILDITGVHLVDTGTADHFIKLVRAAELLGANCVITGIRPAVAQILVELGVELSSIRTLHNLGAGLRYCLRQLSQQRQHAGRVIRDQEGARA